MMNRVRVLAAMVVAMGAFALAKPAHAEGAVSNACCTSGDGKETCCGETCWASKDSCGAKCETDPKQCLPDQ
ncbi:MAG: hypothetical protein IT357_09550 [Gemmatimonadaceae bacterium]|nr:hypothetical protein [Gemmatimonadaceae bacterium]